MNFETLKVTQSEPPNSGIFFLYLNNPSRRNALTPKFFTEFPKALSLLDQNPSAKLIILASNGDHFCSGIDILSLKSLQNQQTQDQGRAREALRRAIKEMQSAITAIELCRKPVIASIHGACIGGGVDLITACDLRLCSKQAFFSVKEVDLGLTADLGSLQRLPYLIGYGNTMDLALTCRRIDGLEAKKLGLVQTVFESRDDLEKGVMELASSIAEKSPMALMGTKAVMLKGRELGVEHGLDYVATWNSAMLLSKDLEEAVEASVQKRKPVFAKL
ncbi:hypothetical protein AMTR_s00016p00201290 [Amborella trichopoda]|uniref:Enoyl-CoA hydratase n=2 Tax=Amborella trichopoda TaxID=13333 RepID=W1PGP3_AMBTC|nr:hypothetical protein AMTR_s00016p00201290 [Amborella trichopoda]